MKAVWLLILLPLYAGERPAPLPGIVFETQAACARLGSIIIVRPREFVCVRSERRTGEAKPL